MTQVNVKGYIECRLNWIKQPSQEITLDEYYDIIDDFQSMLINNPPAELRVA